MSETGQPKCVPRISSETLQLSQQREASFMRRPVLNVAFCDRCSCAADGVSTLYVRQAGNAVWHRSPECMAGFGDTPIVPAEAEEL